MSGKLTFDPVANENGTAYSNFKFKVYDGTTYSTDDYTETIDVTSLNDAPASADGTVTTAEDTKYVFSSSDFSFSDVDAGDTIQKIKVTELETAGALKLDGVEVTLDQEILISDIVSGKLTFDPVANENGTAYSNFKFKVYDGTAYSAADYTETIDVTPVDDPIPHTPLSVKPAQSDPIDPPAITVILGKNPKSQTVQDVLPEKDQGQGADITKNEPKTSLITYSPNSNGVIPRNDFQHTDLAASPGPVQGLGYDQNFIPGPGSTPVDLAGHHENLQGDKVLVFNFHERSLVDMFSHQSNPKGERVENVAGLSNFHSEVEAGKVIVFNMDERMLMELF